MGGALSAPIRDYVSLARSEGRAVDAEDNEELRNATDEPFSLTVQQVCNENMELKYRFVDLVLREAPGRRRGSWDLPRQQSRRSTSARLSAPSDSEFSVGSSVACRARCAGAVRGQVGRQIVQQDLASPG
jgi:hypothetical protein